MTETDRMPEPQIADAVKDNWVDRYAPVRARPFLRLSRADRPVGTWLLLLPCLWGLMLGMLYTGRAGWFDLWIAIGCAIGAFLMRGAGCTWNDITDRDIDGSVERTVNRPIPSGPVVLYLAGIAWTLFYDTIYAHQDAEDDALIGVKSTARLFGDSTPRWLRYFMVATVTVFGVAVILAAIDRSVLSLVVALGAPWAMGWHLAWQQRSFDAEDGSKLLMLFRSNRDAGLIPLPFFAIALLL